MSAGATYPCVCGSRQHCHQHDRPPVERQMAVVAVTRVHIPVAIVVGVDPGPIPGIVGLLIESPSVEGVGRITDVQLAQVTPGLIGLTIGGLVMRWKRHPDIELAREAPVVIAVERFVTGYRASRSSTAGAGATTRDMIGVVQRCAEELEATVIQRNASQAKNWGTEERLERAGLDFPSGMRHAKDAGRHALLAACKAELLPDPLSSTYRKPRLR